MRKTLRKKVLARPWQRPLVYAGIVLALALGRFVFLDLQKESVQHLDYDPVERIAGDFARGERLGEVLAKNQITPELTAEITKTLRTVFNPRRLRAGDRYVLEISTTGTFMHLTLERDLKRYVVHYGPEAGALQASIQTAPLIRTVKGRAGRIQSSVWESMTANGIPASVIDGFENAFRFTIDFLTEPRNGDTFSVLWEETRTPRGTLMGAKILGAMYDGKTARTNTAVLYDGTYWSGSGESLSRIFLAAPLKRYRISSRFSRRRLHPIRRVYRPHLGIDYAAPTGTPIVSVGAGRVSYKGWKGGFGRTIMVKHAQGYESLYGHMSRYARGIKPGTKVRQGQVIGYVGSSGLSTGPHLDFRIKHRGKWKNFLSMKIPADRRIGPADIGAFETTKNDRLKRLRRFIREL